MVQSTHSIPGPRDSRHGIEKGVLTWTSACKILILILRNILFSRIKLAFWVSATLRKPRVISRRVDFRSRREIDLLSQAFTFKWNKSAKNEIYFVFLNSEFELEWISTPSTVFTVKTFTRFVPRDWYRELYGNGHIVVVYLGYFSIDMVLPFLDVV